MDEIQQKALAWSPSEWKDEINTLSPEQISLTIPLASKQYDPQQWQAKISAAIQGLSDKAQLENVGQVLSLEQVEEIFSQATQNSLLLDKLPPLLVGLPHQLFRTLLTKLSPAQLLILKHEIFSESAQYHLTLLSHELDADLTAYRLSQENLQRELENLTVADLGLTEIHALFSKIEGESKKGDDLLAEIDKALALAWSAGRSDLITQLSSCKEICQKILSHSIGKQLPEALENRLNSAFEEKEQPDSIGTLRDEEPAIQALAKFGVWYLEDFWKLGLLPGIKTSDELENQSSAQSKMDRTAAQEKLFTAAQDTLEKLGLKTVKDLKKALIYSKKGLQEYLRLKDEG